MEHIDSLCLSSQHCVWNKSMQNDLHIERWKSCSCLCTLTSVRSRGWNSHIEDSAIPSFHTSESQPLSIYGATQLVRTNRIGAWNGSPQEGHDSNLRLGFWWCSCSFKTLNCPFRENLFVTLWNGWHQGELETWLCFYCWTLWWFGCFPA